MALAIRIYNQLKDCRDFSLKDQMQRASVSIPSNIGEGKERGGKDFQRFLRIARGSSAELRTQLTIASQVKVLSPTEVAEMIEELTIIAKMLTRLDHSIDVQPQPQKAQAAEHH